MKHNLIISRILLGLFLLPVGVSAQSYWKVTYQGTETGGGTNKLATVAVTENTFIQRCASDGGVSASDLVLVLHVNANELGDTLEVVNKNDPNLFRCEVFKLAYIFSGSPSQSYTNSAGTSSKRFAYIFGNQDAHSRGSVIITQHNSVQQGTSTPLTIEGKVQYWLGLWDETVPDPTAKVASGTFKTTGPL